MRRLPPLKALPAFELAAESLSISAAAQELHLTHGAVSRQIKALEDHLGAPLFRRFNRRIELTAAGAAFLPHVRQALQVLQTSAAAARTRQGPARGLLPRHLHDALADPAALCLQRRQPRDRGAAFRVPCPARFRRRRHRRRNPAGQAAVAERRRWASIPCRPRRPGRGPCPAPGSTHQATRRPPAAGPAACGDETRSLGAVVGDDGCRGLRRDQRGAVRAHVFPDGGRGERARRRHRLLSAGEQDLESGRLVAPFGFVPSGSSYCLLRPRLGSDVAKSSAFLAWISAQAKTNT